MYTGFFDIINSILQFIMIISTINYCIDKKYKKSRAHVFIWVILTSLVTILITSIMGNYSLSIIIMHIVSLILVIAPYHKDKLTAIIGFSIVYSMILILSVMSTTMLSFFTSIANADGQYGFLMMIGFTYLPSYIFTYFFLRNMKSVYKLYLIVKSRITFINTLIIATLIFDFVISLSFIANDKDNPVFKEIIFILLGVFIILITWYFINIDKNSKEIHRLNKELENKINELKKVKHDYGSQISYLYGAYLMKNYDKLGELFKSVIDGNNISTQIKALSNEESIISKIVHSIDFKDIAILIDEKAQLELSKINEIDLHKIISNIVRNSIEVLDGKGLLMIRSYYNYNNIVISIQNNGPQIDSNIINKIFEQGFSTKENKDGDNGFGLYIVKEIINKYNGNIHVTSSQALTEFVINLPLYID